MTHERLKKDAAECVMTSLIYIHTLIPSHSRAEVIDGAKVLSTNSTKNISGIIQFRSSKKKGKIKTPPQWWKISPMFYIINAT